MKEEWRPVKDFEGLYEVSSFGKVRSVVKSKILKPFFGGTPGKMYPKVTLCNNGHQRDVKVHVLVLETFIGPRPPGYESRHLNGDRSDSSLTNLAWGTHAENNEDAMKHGMIRLGERHQRAKLTAEDVKEIRRLTGVSLSKLGRKFGVSPQHISKLKKRLVWAFLP